MNKRRFVLRESKISLVAIIECAIVAPIPLVLGNRFDFPPMMWSAAILLTGILSCAFCALLFKRMAAFVEICTEGIRCYLPFKKRIQISWNEIKSAGVFVEKTPILSDVWLYISKEEKPLLDKDKKNTTEKIIYAIDRYELRESLIKHGIIISDQ